MFIEERHRKILEILNEKGRITTSEIQRHFSVGFDSARRDLRILEEQGLLKRTHGGAIVLEQTAFSKPPKTTPKDVTFERENYVAIAKRAVSKIVQNDVIFISSATVCYFMIKYLPENLRIRVATNSIVLAEELRCRDNVSVILLGGEMDQKGNCYDMFAVNMLRELRFDKCFLTSAGISADFGLSIQHSNAKAFWNAVIDSSRKSFGLYPTEKIGFESIVSICPAERLDCIITDWDAPEDELKKFDKKGIELEIVEKTEEEQAI